MRKAAIPSLALVLVAGASAWCTFLAPWVKSWSRLDTGMFLFGVVLPVGLIYWAGSLLLDSGGRRRLNYACVALLGVVTFRWAYRVTEDQWNLRSYRSDRSVIDAFLPTASERFKAGALETVMYARKLNASRRQLPLPEEMLLAGHANDEIILSFEPALQPTGCSWNAWEPVTGTVVGRLRAVWFLDNHHRGSRWVGAADSLNRFEWIVTLHEDHYWDGLAWKLVGTEVEYQIAERGE